MTDLKDLRVRIDAIDSQIIDLFNERASVANEIGAYKRESGLPVLDRQRERQKVASAAAQADPDLKTHAQVLMELLMEASRTRQTTAVAKPNETLDAISSALNAQPELFPTDSFVACQGVEGAYSQIAAERIFKHPQISYFSTFDAVFKAVEQGFCDFGVLPVENSYAGSVNQVFDLMMRHNFYIVRSTRLKVNHNLLVKPGTKLEDIRVVYSHQQAISQCAEYLAALPGVKVHVCENTAIAAKKVADSEQNDVAALSSLSCAELYGLEAIAKGVQDSGANYTRFATISRELTIYPGANRTSLMVVLGHHPGSLYKVLAKFYALDINIVKLESRPIPERDFEFMFYFDIDCPVAAPEFKELMATLPNLCEDCRYLGSYTEVV